MQTSPRLDRRVTTSAVIGTVIEWYDFYIYGTASALVFGALFFHADDPLTGTIAAFATFAVGFLARPVGAAVFGHYGDRIGRKKMLIFSLVGMGVATLAVGLLPTYAQVGVLAPVLLVTCRLVQGFCVGGEWGGAMLLAVEHAPVGRKNLAGSLVQVGSPAGLVIATGLIAVFSAQPDEVFLTWGWRVPFLFSAVLVAVGLFIRLKVDESPEFQQLRSTGDTVKVPLLQTLRTAPLQVLTGVALTCGPFVYFYFLTTFLLTFGINDLGFDRQFLLVSVTVAAGIEVFTLPVAGALADRYGRGRIFTTGAVALVLLAFPAVWLLLANPGNRTVLLATMVFLMAVVHPLTYALLSTKFTDLFATEIRYTGVSLAFQLGGVVGGFSPLILTAALTSPSASWLIPGYLALLSAVSVVAALAVVRRSTRTREAVSV